MILKFNNYLPKYTGSLKNRFRYFPGFSLGITLLFLMYRCYKYQENTFFQKKKGSENSNLLIFSLMIY